MNLTPTTTVMPEVSLTVNILPVLLFIATVVCFVSFFIALRQRMTEKHSLYWALGGGLAITGLLLVVLRAALPPLLSILLGNWLLLAGEAMFAAGARRFIGRSASFEAFVGATAISVFTFAYLADVDVLLRVTIYTLTCSCVSLRAAMSFFFAPRSWATIGAGVVASIVFCVEISRACLIYADIVSPVDMTAINAFSVMFGLPISIIVALAVIILHWRYLVEFFRPRTFATTDNMLAEQSFVASAYGNDEAVPYWSLIAGQSVLRAPDGREVRLTGKEYMLLHKLSEVGDTVDRLTLNTVIGRSAVDPKDRGIDILFSRLRRKCLEEGVSLPINALRSQGYVFLGKLHEK